MAERITLPLLKSDGGYRQVSFEDAFQIIFQKMSLAAPNKTLMMTTGDYSNEELYLIQRLARAGFRTNALASFDYYNRGTSFFIDKNDIVPFAELFGSDLLLCMLDEKADSESAKTIRSVIEHCTSARKYWFNQSGNLQVKDYGAFFRALCWYLIHNDLAKGIYVDGLGKDYEAYKTTILQQDVNELLKPNNLTLQDVAEMIEMLRSSQAPVFVIWERLLDERGIIEVENLSMLLDIQAKPSSGFLSVKADLNSQGLFDMGIFPQVCVGGLPFSDENIGLMRNLYGKDVVTESVDVESVLRQHAFANCFIWNSTGEIIPGEVLAAVQDAMFSVLQTAEVESGDALFDLILPASLPAEVEGSFTDSARIPHNSKPAESCPVEYNNMQLISALGEPFGLASLNTASEAFLEYISFMKGGCRSKYRHFFR